MGIIYLLTCPHGRSYVGKTKQNIGKRINAHRCYSSGCRAIRDAFKLYGNAIKVTILMRCPEADMDANETLYIEKLDTVYPRGYNLRCGNMAATPASEFAITTWHHSPVQYFSDTDNDEVQASVQEAVNELLLEADYKPWAGPIQMSVAELNQLRGAIQKRGWTGSVSKSSDDVFEQHMLGCLSNKSFSGLLSNPCQCMNAFTHREHKILLKNWEKRMICRNEMNNVAAEKEILEYEKSLSILASKIDECEGLGMQEEVVTLKRKLVQM